MTANVRLDKYIANLGIIPRRSVGKAITNGAILLDSEVVQKSDQKISYGQTLTIYDEEIEVREFVYIILHKPSGYVCSELDEGGHLSYKNLLTDCPYKNFLHVAGRLDFDTEGVVLSSNDGQFTHNIISPKKHLEKQYYVETSTSLSRDDLKKLEAGVTLDDGYQTLPAKATYVNDSEKNKIYLTITEGKFHQVKRMIEAIGSEVTYLRRDRIGQWTLDGLKKGEWKYIEV